MKIKQEKQLNLPQLIEWAWENEIKNKEYPCVGFESKTVIFNGLGWAEFSDEYSYNLTDTFTVEDEKEITEDTVIPEMLTIYFNGDSRIQNNKRLNDLNTTYHIKSAYIMNDDLRLILIWRDGKLVE